jgi:hypothetical protein
MKLQQLTASQPSVPAAEPASLLLLLPANLLSKNSMTISRRDELTTVLYVIRH